MLSDVLYHVPVYLKAREVTGAHVLTRCLPVYVVLYGCESWSLTLREECRLRVFENEVLRRIFGPRGMR
jgi:hypothetical protein